MKIFKFHPLVVAIALVSSNSVFAQEGTETEMLEEVLVTGFRQAQAVALNEKRNSANNADVIIAEDIGKMPDLNLAESLQRTPGIAITREGGEGRQITVRGLGPEYTRVTLNGMEVPASAGGTDSSGGTNRGRPFDFNVFGSELFSKIIINKNAISHVEEGGLASTIELFSHKPLDNAGLILTGAIQNAYNMNSGNSSPRVSGFYSQSFMDDKVGILAAVNYSSRDVRQDGFGTVRWTSPTVNGRGDFLEPAGGTQVNGTLGDGVGSINDLFFPRLPRMDSFNRETDRLGIALGLQFRPTDQLEMSLNMLSSKFDQDTTSYNYFAQFRNTFQDITALEVDVSNDGLYAVGGRFEGVSPRSESRVQYGSSEFMQVVADFSYDFSDTLHLSGLIGNASASYTEDYRRYNFDVNSSSTFDFHLTNDENLAEMSYGFDVNDPSLYHYVNARIQRDDVERDYNTFKIDLIWDFGDEGSNVMVGAIANDRNIKSNFFRSASTVIPTLTANNTNTIDEVYGDFGDGIGAPSGFPTSWLVADFEQLYTDLGSPVAEFLPTNTNTYDVTEKTTGLYTEVNWIYGSFFVNAGVRYVETKVTAIDFLEINGVFAPNEATDSYSTVLPAINLTYNITEELKARFSWAKNIARPNPASLSGASTISPENGTITLGNPAIGPELATALDVSLEWYFAEESYIGLSIFQKDITDAISSETIENVSLSTFLRAIAADDPAYATSPNPAGFVGLDEATWDITSQVNSSDVVKLNGWEVGYQQVLAYGIGLLANYTHVDSGDAVIDGLSESTANLGAFWENDTFGIRLVMNTRDDYITREPGRNGNLEERTTGPTRFDVSSHWNVSNNVTITLEVINLTDEKERIYVSGPTNNLDLVREYNTTGTELMFGVRASF